MNRGLWRCAYHAALLLFFAWGANGVFNRLQSWMLTHDHLMLQMSVEDRKASEANALAVCLKRNPVKACRDLP